MTARQRRAGVMVLASLAFAPSAQADSVDALGLGSRATALGGAQAADPTGDFSATAYNPANLVQADRPSISVEYIHLLVPKGGAATLPQRGNRWALGLSAPGQLLGVPLCLGVAAQVDGQGLVHTKTASPSAPFPIRDGHTTEFMNASVALSAKLTPQVSFGAGVGLLAATSARLELTGVAEQPGYLNPEGDENTVYDSTLTHQLDAEVTSLRYPIVGAALNLAPIRLGLSYRGEVEIPLEIDATLDGDVGLGVVTVPAHYQLRSGLIHAFRPGTLSGGVSWNAAPTLLLNVDLSWELWRPMAAPYSASSSTLEVEQPPGLQIGVPDIPAPTSRHSAKLKNTWNPRVGLEWHVGVSKNPLLLRPAEYTVPLRIGYGFEPSPVSRATPPNLLAPTRHTFALGLGLIPNAQAVFSWRLDIHAQWRMLGGSHGVSYGSAGGTLTLLF